MDDTPRPCNHILLTKRSSRAQKQELQNHQKVPKKVNKFHKKLE